jgi:hypothetical protein
MPTYYEKKRRSSHVHPKITMLDDGEKKRSDFGSSALVCIVVWIAKLFVRCDATAIRQHCDQVRIYDSDIVPSVDSRICVRSAAYV